MQDIKLARDRRKKKARVKISLTVLVACVIASLIGVINREPKSSDNISTHSTSNGILTVEQDKQPTELSSDIAVSDENNSVSNSADFSQTEINNNPTHSTTLANPSMTEQNSGETTQTPDEDKQEFYDEALTEDSDNTFSYDELPPEAKSAVDNLLDVAEQALRIKNQFAYTVESGDTLSDVLSTSGLDVDSANQLIAVDSSLKKLSSGQQFYWILNEQGELQYLNWLPSLREERVYQHTAKNTFSKQVITKKSEWKQDVLKGQVQSSLYQSLRQLAVSDRQIKQLTNALQWQVNIGRLQKGDRFAILVNREYLSNKLTGQGSVLGIHIVTRGKSYYAIQAENGRYYNQNAETTGKGFSRYPLQRQYRVTSPFNPRRRHPVTGRIAPHKGVDFGMPRGTPVIAPGDGTVERVSYQANGAGRYIVIRHGREYQTVYMHLSKALVKPGQTVKKGQRIALSGNTGRSTGPHLHYEFHVNGVAVNPMKVKLPGLSNVMNAKEKKAFLTKSKQVQAKLKL